MNAFNFDVQYLLGSILLFAFLNAHEGVIMSLLSKLVSPELAKGTFNSGKAVASGTCTSLLTMFGCDGGCMV